MNNIRYCKHCGNRLSNSDKFCQVCKAARVIPVPAQAGKKPIKKKSKLTILIMVLFTALCISVLMTFAVFFLSKINSPIANAKNNTGKANIKNSDKKIVAPGAGAQHRPVARRALGGHEPQGVDETQTQAMLEHPIQAEAPNEPQVAVQAALDNNDSDKKI